MARWETTWPGKLFVKAINTFYNLFIKPDFHCDKSKTEFTVASDPNPNPRPTPTAAQTAIPPSTELVP